MNTKKPSFFEADWPAPRSVRTLLTTRVGGFGQTPYSSFNLATHVNDNIVDVKKNRALLADEVNRKPVPKAYVKNANSLSDTGNIIQWLSQVHSTKVLSLDNYNPGNQTASRSLCPEADGVSTTQKNKVCAVLTADCLPVLMCNRQGTEVAAIHAGWQGLAKGILSQALKSFSCAPCDVLCYLGPAISSKYYEVGHEILQAFEQAEKSRPYAEKVRSSFSSSPNSANNKYLADLYRLARSELVGAGCVDIYGGHLCTYDDQKQFFSYRRDGVTGRMASLIWME